MRGGARRPQARRSPATLSLRSRAPTKQMGPYRRPALTDFPSLARDKELADVAGTPVRDGLLLLLDQDLLVCRHACLIEQRSEGDRILGGPELGEQRRGRAVG